MGREIYHNFPSTLILYFLPGGHKSSQACKWLCRRTESVLFLKGKSTVFHPLMDGRSDGEAIDSAAQKPTGQLATNTSSLCPSAYVLALRLGVSS
jgi:hypothetical protein